MKDGKFRPDWGTLSVEAREFLLEELLETQEQMNEIRMEDYGLPYFELISQEELDYIHKQIAEDREKRPYLAKGMVPGKYGSIFREKLQKIIVEKHGVKVS